MAVDAKGMRTPVSKGSRLLPGQRLQTGPGGYAQVKLNDAAAVGVGEQASIRFDRNAVVLDQGRVRMVGGEAFGKPITQPIELRTTDGTVVLRGADIEAKKAALGVATPTLVKVNAGDARLGSGATEIQLPTQGVQGISVGRLAGAPVPITDLLPPTRAMNGAAPRGPINIAAAPLDLPGLPVLRTDRLTPVLEMPTRPIPILTAPVKPPLLQGERFITRKFTVGDRETNLAELIKDPTILTNSTLTAPTTTSTTSLTTTLDSSTLLQSPTYTLQIAPTLSTTTSTTSLQTTTTTTTTLSPTYTISPTYTLSR
jgi:hypothetical protein